MNRFDVFEPAVDAFDARPGQKFDVFTFFFVRCGWHERLTVSADNRCVPAVSSVR